MVTLCKAWEIDQDNGVAPDRSTAYRGLVAAAGSEDAVGTYCASAAIAVAESTTDGPTTKPAPATSDTTPSPETGSPSIPVKRCFKRPMVSQ